MHFWYASCQLCGKPQQVLWLPVCYHLKHQSSLSSLTYLFVISYIVYLELATTSFQCIKLWFLRNVFPCSISRVCRVFFVNTLHVLTVEKSPCSRYTDASSTFLLQKFVIARVCSPDSAKKKKVCTSEILLKSFRFLSTISAHCLLFLSRQIGYWALLSLLSTICRSMI